MSKSRCDVQGGPAILIRQLQIFRMSLKNCFHFFGSNSLLDGIMQFSCCLPRNWHKTGATHTKRITQNCLWTMDYGLWTMDYGLWTMDYGLWTMDYGLWTGPSQGSVVLSNHHDRRRQNGEAVHLSPLLQTRGS